MNAQDAVIAAGITSKRGFWSSPVATAEKIGITKAAVAVLEVNSVKKIVRDKRGERYTREQINTS